MGAIINRENKRWILIKQNGLEHGGCEEGTADGEESIPGRQMGGGGAPISLQKEGLMQKVNRPIIGFSRLNGMH